MSRLVCSLVLACVVSWVACFSPAAAAAQADALTGTWVLDVERSKADRPLPTHETRTYSLNFTGGITLVVEGVDADGTQYAYGASGDLNGRQYPVVGRDVGARILGDAIAWRHVDPLTVEMTIKKKADVINTTRHSVSKDGKTLTVTENGMDDENKPIHQTLVFDRQ